MMVNKDRLAALALAATMGIAWSLPAQAGEFFDGFTLHPAAVSLTYAIQQVGDDCRGDAESCIDRGRLNTRDLTRRLCGMEDVPRDYRLVLVFPCTELAADWYIWVWDRENEQFAQCDRMEFRNRMAIFAESNRGDLREMRILSDTTNFNAVDQGIPQQEFGDQLSATAVVRIAQVPRRLLGDQEQSGILAETLEGIDSGVEEAEAPRCAASISTNSVLGILESRELEQNEPMAQSQLINGNSIGLMMIEKGRITGGRPFGLLID